MILQKKACGDGGRADEQTKSSFFLWCSAAPWALLSVDRKFVIVQ